MIIVVDDKLRDICLKIRKEDKTIAEWAEIESDDQFYEFPYEGGFEALEEAFWFSYYADDGNEYVFKLTLDDVSDILSGKITQIKANDEINIFNV